MSKRLAQKFRQRVRQLELVRREASRPRIVLGFYTAEDWLGYYESRLKDGSMHQEPEYPKAVTDFRTAIQTAISATGESFEPPDHFLPERPLRERRQAWRRPRAYRSVTLAFIWLTTFTERVQKGQPPITEAEYNELKRWLSHNDAALGGIMSPSEYVAEIVRHRHRFEEPWGTHRINGTVGILRSLRSRFSSKVPPDD